MKSNFPSSPVRERTAAAPPSWTPGHTYAELLDASARVASALLGEADDLGEARVCFLVPPSFEQAAVQWGV